MRRPRAAPPHRVVGLALPRRAALLIVLRVLRILGAARVPFPLSRRTIMFRVLASSFPVRLRTPRPFLLLLFRALLSLVLGLVNVLPKSPCTRGPRRCPTCTRAASRIIPRRGRLHPMPTLTPLSARRGLSTLPRVVLVIALVSPRIRPLRVLSRSALLRSVTRHLHLQTSCNARLLRTPD